MGVHFEFDLVQMKRWKTFLRFSGIKINRATFQCKTTKSLGCKPSGMEIKEILEDFPEISHEEVLACLDFAADKENEN